MSYKSILVNLDADRSNVVVVKAASALAQRWNARLIGFCAADAYLPVTGPEGATLAGEVWQQMRDDDERRFKDRRKEFEALVAGAAETEWRDAMERPTYALVQASRAADLVVMQAADGAATRDTARRSDPGSAVLQTGRPLLIVGTGTEHRIGRKIVVAWKDTKEARRAVFDAIPLLQAADDVIVVTVASTIDQCARASIADITAFLARHGVAARNETVESYRESDSLIALVDRYDADLVVSGAFGHSRLREWAFGGMTRSLLDETRLNRFMSS
ncbi:MULTISPECIES: universal stress protein [unclassified Shinella]|uniref:universal stress protein n=1 Tax=unclassified Shinella TaxID=2643062 RepID=UPI00225C83EE|nr:MULTISPECIES: universal stress protein [unclassified Shinella]MCO5139692.1 universal stress protein [Shinella sp.]MDC7258671.1 universal stress protein [Shinella sp. YE25]CAI0335019.1 Universal stress protein family protein [Rhizobiaceae bacterium]CAK7260435.1 Universal stress protein family protein [Shinella sp. WSC3-e]